MTKSIRHTTWEGIQELRGALEMKLGLASTVEEAARRFVAGVAEAFDTVVLARLFLVLPASDLPPDERAWAERFARAAGRLLADTTPVLTLLGTAGTDPSWNERRQSAGHRAIPLLDPELVEGAPMLAELLASLRVELVGLRADAPAQLRMLPGGLNARFFVPDAQTAVDSKGRHIIASRDFVTKYAIASVFGMGGVYVGGALAAAIIFTREALTATEVDRFPTFISTFKMSTARLMSEGKIFDRL